MVTILRKRMSQEEKGPYRRRNEDRPAGEGRQEEAAPAGVWDHLLRFLGGLLRMPFRMLFRYFRRELTEALKKDLRIYLLILLILGMVIVFFVILWLSVAVAVGVWFYTRGTPLFLSVLYSILFQVVVILLALLATWIISRRRRTGKLLRELRDAARTEG